MNTQSDTIPKLPSTPLRFVAYFLKYFWLPLSFMASFEIIQKVCEVLIPYLFKELLDGTVAFKGPPEQLYDHLLPLILYFLGISLGTVIFARASGAILVYVGPALRKLIRSNIYHYIQNHSHRYFISNFAGSLANRVNEVAMSVGHGWWTVMFDFLPVTISFGVSLYLLFSAHAMLGAYLAIWIFLYISMSFLLARKCQTYSRKFAAERSRTTGHIVDAVTNIMNTKIFAKSDFERSRLDSQLTTEMNTARTTFWFMEKLRWFQFTAAFVLQVGLVLYSLHLFSINQISVGNFAMVASLGLLIISDARGLSRRFLEFFEYLGNINDGVSTFIKPHEILDRKNATSLNVGKGQIQFKDTCFGYSPDSLVFDKLNVRIKPGEKVGLVGFSGSGKSTFVNLLLRLFDIQKGEILIDGQSITEITQNSLRENISMVPQDPMLFHRSLKENIRYAKPEATDEMVFEASKKANAHEFIMDTKEGYEALVGERGIKLSGGQRQRIAIARAILKDAPILILDEATSSLDSVTEKEIQSTLEILMERKTVLVVAHRLSTIAHMDRIIVFDQGKIVEDGTHDDLLKNKSHYSLLWSMQAGGFLPYSNKQDNMSTPEL